MPAPIEAVSVADVTRLEQWAEACRGELLALAARRRELAEELAAVGATTDADTGQIPAEFPALVDALLETTMRQLEGLVETARAEAEARILDAAREAAAMIAATGADAREALCRIAPAMPPHTTPRRPRNAEELWRQLIAPPDPPLGPDVASRVDAQVYDMFWSDAAQSVGSVRERLRRLSGAGT